jgi:branched-chain amino acid aminotransferase
MPIVPLELFMNALDSLIRLDAHWVSGTEGTSLYIRPFMFATEDKLGVQIADHYRFMIVCSPVGKYYSKFLRVKVEQKYTRAFPGGTGFAKCGGNYGVSFYPYKEAHDEGFDQILWTDGATHQFLDKAEPECRLHYWKQIHNAPSYRNHSCRDDTDSLLHIAAEKVCL